MPSAITGKISAVPIEDRQDICVHRGFAEVPILSLMSKRLLRLPLLLLLLSLPLLLLLLLLLLPLLLFVCLNLFVTGTALGLGLGPLCSWDCLASCVHRGVAEGSDKIFPVVSIACSGLVLVQFAFLFRHICIQFIG